MPNVTIHNEITINTPTGEHIPAWPKEEHPVPEPEKPKDNLKYPVQEDGSTEAKQVEDNSNELSKLITSGDSHLPAALSVDNEEGDTKRLLPVQTTTDNTDNRPREIALGNNTMKEINGRVF